MSIVLKSNDNKEIIINKTACKRSKFLQSQIEGGKTEIVLEDIKGDVLALVVDYLKEYTNKEPGKIPDVLKSNDLSKELSAFDYEFISKISYENSFHLINAGVLLELEHCHDLACARIAAFMKGKSVEEVNKEFTIECQLTQEEAKELGLETDA